jgi:hypothetical protein
MAEKGEGIGGVASCRMAAVYEPAGQPWSQGAAYRVGIKSRRRSTRLTLHVNGCIFRSVHRPPRSTA